MGTWRSAAPRGQFGDQAGDTIFTSNRPINSRRRLGGDGRRKGPLSSPRATLGSLTRRALAACPSPCLGSQCPPHLPPPSLAQSQQVWPLKSNWPLPSTFPACPDAIHCHLSSNCTILLPGVSMFIWAPATEPKPNAEITTSSGISSFLENTPTCPG